jgi:iron complex transport system permease protein
MTLHTMRARGVSIRYDRRTLLVGGFLVALTVVVGLFALGSGDYPLPLDEVVRTLFGRGKPAAEFVVESLRLPRLLTGIGVGIALGAAGAVFQSLTRNPLGSPDMIGFTQGSAAGGIVVILLLNGTAAQTSFGALAGGLITAVLLYGLAWREGISGYRLVLVGVGITAILAAANAYLLARAQLSDAQRVVAWQVGSLAGREWTHVTGIWVTVAVLVPLALMLGRPLRMLELGDDAAVGLGVSANRARIGLLAVGVGFVAVATAAAGPVPFVALAAPHIARRLTRAAGPNLGPAMCTGALLTIAADYAAQHAFDDTQLPLGVVTSVTGGAYLVWLLLWQRRAGRL